MKFKNIKVLRFDFIDRNNEIHKYKDISKLPKECPVTINFDTDRRVGTATNFKKLKDGINCDIELDEDNKYFNTIVPSMVGEMSIGKKNEMVLIKAEVKELAVVQEPADIKLKGNLKKARKETSEGYPYIEEMDYPDRTEFRLVIQDKNPFDKKAKPFETYAGRYKEYGTDKHSLTKFEEYYHVAYKNNNWLKRLMGRDYYNQRMAAISELTILKRQIEKQNIKPIIRRIENEIN